MAARGACAADSDAGRRPHQQPVGQDAATQCRCIPQSLNETGYVEGQNVTVEYHWLEGQFNRLPALVDDLIRRRVA